MIVQGWGKKMCPQHLPCISQILWTLEEFNIVSRPKNLTQLVCGFGGKCHFKSDTQHCWHACVLQIHFVDPSSTLVGILISIWRDLGWDEQDDVVHCAMKWLRFVQMLWASTISGVLESICVNWASANRNMKKFRPEGSYAEVYSEIRQWEVCWPWVQSCQGDLSLFELHSHPFPCPSKLLILRCRSNDENRRELWSCKDS